MQASINIPLACALGILVSACGGGGGTSASESTTSTPTTTTTTTTTSTATSGTTATGPAVFTPNDGRLLASQCFQCHGTDGRSVSGIESLAGEGGEIVGEMLKMQSSTSVSIMHKQAKGYTALQVQLIGDYFSTVSGSNGTGGGSDD